ncbi:hypothetical protein JTE90_021901 [Oedothorax gibbosus]|uniref:Ribonuclease P protein subunit p20 n=1 Tax=Oedothorax gibbosus TaxID=931172 RepID=A0AAV6VXI4_9ARAC|nr:hypothetical protein JTE90_021901 [Oedothorax gibbosus]
MGTSKINWKSPNSNREGENWNFPGSSHGSEKDSVDDPDYLFTKRLPPKLPKSRSDVYVNQKSSFVAQFNKCKSLLSSEKEIRIHGLGAAVNTAVNLALQLKTFYLETVTLEATTSTVDLIDDFTPRTPVGRHRTVKRKNSAIHIKMKQVSEPK